MAHQSSDQGAIPQQIQKETLATNITGTVKWFNRTKGFGFITRDDTKEDIFSHHTSIKPVSLNQRYLNRPLILIDQEKVQFDVVKAPNGLEAANIVGKNGYLVLDIIALKRDIPSFDLKIINEARVTGKVKWFNVKIKYGFIHCDYNNEDVFVHSSAIIKNNPNKYKPSLNEGEPVEFDILKRADGKLEAVNVSGPNGSNVEGSRYSPDKINRLETSTNKNYIEENVLGKVKWFNVKAGFGFISRDENGQDVYAHYTAISKKNPEHRVRSLADGESVKFNIVEGTKGLEASDITGADGGHVQGSEYARPNRDLSSKGQRSTSRPGQMRENRRPPMRPVNSQGRPMRPQRGGMRMNGRNFNNQNSFSQNRVPLNNFVPNQFGQTGPINQSFPQQNRPRGRGNFPNIQPLMSNAMPTFQPTMRLPPQQYPVYGNNGRYLNGNNNYMSGEINAQNNFFRPPHNPYYYQQNEQRELPQNMRFVDRRVRGVSKWYNFKNGFGFVTRTDTNQDIFVHKTGIQGTNRAIPSLDDGEPVEFDIIQDENKLIAVNVTGPNGALLRGSKYAPEMNMRQSRSRNENVRGVNSLPRQRNINFQPRPKVN
ncbi:unnamed protein product [Brachionus calyciflorus]|uniref:CSD domain-containing protein n=1 Tax=Brachionus calyciflorus TaxID=104777 RepID=A0A813M543_9BILA|nr:unnamed protein product [Brachionus calyciflorus]